MESVAIMRVVIVGIVPMVIVMTIIIVKQKTVSDVRETILSLLVLNEPVVHLVQPGIVPRIAVKISVEFMFQLS